MPEGNYQVSIPYFTDGKTINIYNAQNNNLALSIDVSQFAVNMDKFKTEPVEPTASATVPTEQPAANSIWSTIKSILIIILVLVIIVGAILYYRKRKTDYY